MHIVLIILKVIGIVLLCIIGFLLFLILSLLFAPFRYKIVAHKNEEDDIKKTYARARVSWLLFVVRVNVFYKNEEIGYGLRLFGINLLKVSAIFKRLKRTNNKATKKTTKNQSEKVKTINEASIDSVKSNTSSDNCNNTDNVQNKENQNNKEINNYNNESFGEESEKESKLDKIKGILAKIGEVKDKLTDERNKETLKFVIKMLKDVLRYIGPTKLKGDLTFGFSSPDKTGKTLALLAMIYPIYAKNFKITPDFVNECIYGKIFAKGRVRLFTLIRFYIKLKRSGEYDNLMSLIK